MGLQWSRDRAQKKRMGRRRAEMTWRGLRKTPEKFRRKGLCCLPLVRIVVMFSLF